VDQIWNAKIIWLLVWLLIWSVWDLRYRVVPFWQVVFVFGAGLLWQLCQGQLWTTDVLGGLLVGGITGTISWLTQEQLGWGDAMVILCMGVYLGAADCVEALLWGLMAASLFSLYLLVFKKKSSRQSIPFIPFLTMGCGVLFFMRMAGGV